MWCKRLASISLAIFNCNMSGTSGATSSSVVVVILISLRGVFSISGLIYSGSIANL